MDFIDLKTQQKKIKETLDANIQKVLAHGNYIMGPEVKELEQKLASYVGIKHAIGCASGTDALLMALMAYGVGPRDAINAIAKDEAHRADLLKRLQEAKIPAAIYYPKPLHMQTAFAFLGYAPGAYPSVKTQQTVSSASPCIRI